MTMKLGMTFKQRDILLVPVPFTDLSSTKQRPVIVLSNDRAIESSPDLLVVAVTSNLLFANDYTVEIDSSDIENRLLPRKSVVRCDKLYTISKDIVLKRFNRIRQEVFLRLIEVIKKLITPAS